MRMMMATGMVMVPMIPGGKMFDDQEAKGGCNAKAKAGQVAGWCAAVLCIDHSLRQVPLQGRAKCGIN